jgi:hypothetical protein
MISEKVKEAHSAAALYLALMQLPGAKSHIFNEFAFRSAVQTIPLIVSAPRGSNDAQGKRRKRPAATNKAQRAKHEGTRKSSRVAASSVSSQHAADDDDDEANDDTEACQTDDEADSSGGSPRGKSAQDKEVDCTYTYTYTYTHIHICLYVRMYACMHVHIYAYILHTHTDEREVAGHQCAVACEALGRVPVPADSSSGTPPARTRDH